MTSGLKILNVVGARANLPKIAPLLREMRLHPEITAILVHTGQHYDENLSDIFFRQMGIPAPQVNLEVGSGSHAAQTAEILKRIEPVLEEHRPEVVVVVGDVNSTPQGWGSAWPTWKRDCAVLTDAIADHLFVTEEDAITNLMREGRPRDTIFLVGNVMIDSLRHFLPAVQQSSIGAELGLKNGVGWGRFGVLTLHRPSNVDSPDRLNQLLGAVDAVAAEVP